MIGKPVWFRKKLTKYLQININVNTINRQVVEKLKSLFEQHPGTCGIKITLTEKVEKIIIPTLVRRYRIAPKNINLKS